MNGQERDQKFSQIPYYERLELFTSSPFEIGEILKVPSPYPDDFISLTIPSYKGLPRIGKQHTYEGAKISNIQEYNKTKQERIAARAWQNQNLGVYFGLFILDKMKEHVLTDEMLERFKFGDRFHSYYSVDGGKDPHFFKFQPRNLLEGLAAGTLLPQKFREYYCTEEVHCSAAILRRVGNRWGGNVNEFKARKAYSEYLNKEVPKLKEWSSQISNEVYYVFTAALSSYDFAKGGYQLELLPERSITQESGTNLYYWPQDEANALMPFKGGTKTLFIEISDTEAEAIDKELTQKGQTSFKRFFAVVKAEIYGLTRASRNSVARSMHYGSPNGLLLDITDPKIEFFLDEGLTEKVSESTLKLE